MHWDNTQYKFRGIHFRGYFWWLRGISFFVVALTRLASEAHRKQRVLGAKFVFFFSCSWIWIYIKFQLHVLLLDYLDLVCYYIVYIAFTASPCHLVGSEVVELRHAAVGVLVMLMFYVMFVIPVSNCDFYLLFPSIGWFILVIIVLCTLSSSINWRR